MKIVRMLVSALRWYFEVVILSILYSLIISVGKKTPFSALRLSENSSITPVNSRFYDFTSLENEVFLSNTRLSKQALIKKTKNKK